MFSFWNHYGYVFILEPMWLCFHSGTNMVMLSTWNQYDCTVNLEPIWLYCHSGTVIVVLSFWLVRYKNVNFVLWVHLSCYFYSCSHSMSRHPCSKLSSCDPYLPITEHKSLSILHNTMYVCVYIYIITFCSVLLDCIISGAFMINFFLCLPSFQNILRCCPSIKP